MIPDSNLFDQSIIAALLDHDPVVLGYRTLFALFDWTIIDAWQAQWSDRGRPGHPISAYLKAFLVRLNEGITTASQLRRFLIKHPLLGFNLEQGWMQDRFSLPHRHQAMKQIHKKGKE